MSARIANPRNTSRLALEVWLAMLATWLVLQNAVLLGVAGSHVDWPTVGRTVAGLVKIGEVLLATLGPRLLVGSALVAAVAVAVVLGAARIAKSREEARHA